MTRTTPGQREQWSLNPYSDSSQSEKSISVSSSSLDEPRTSSRKNPRMSKNPRRPRDPRSRRKPSSAQKRGNLSDHKIGKKSGYQTSSDESSNHRYDLDDSTTTSSEAKTPNRRRGKGEQPNLEYGDPRRHRNYGEENDDTDRNLGDDDSDADDSWMQTPPKKTASKLNNYVKESPPDLPVADVENQKNDDGDANDDGTDFKQFERRFSAENLGFDDQKLNANPDEDSSSSSGQGGGAKNSSSSDGPRDGARNARTTKAPANDSKDTNTDDSIDDNFDDKPIPERRRFLTRERKIITCLTLFLCCFCLLAAMGIGIGIGLASSDSNDRVIVVPSETAPTLPPSNVTEAPTMQPSRPLDVELLEYLIDNSFDNGAALQTQGTPQRSAYEWLSRNAELPKFTNEVKLARYALATFFFSTNGPSTWSETIRDDGWMTDAPECEWASTARNQCAGTTYSSLTLDFVGVSGQIPPELAYLTGLTRLSLRSEGISSPTITGSLPSTIGRLQNLQTIRLNENNIGGSLPTTIGSLTNVRVLLMSGNSLEGSIPSEIGRTMGNTFNFDRNRLSGRLPVELFRMGTLTALNFEDNTISGPIPNEIGMNPSLNSINFANNRLTGTIPTEFGRLVTVRSGINLSNNNLSGSLPTELGFLADMQNLLVNNNRLVGEVPLQYDSLRDMRLLRIDGNQLTGAMPSNVCNSFTDRTVSYSDCGTQAFQCPCCTFCCTGGTCFCNVDDESICRAAVLASEGTEVNQATSELYYSESEENQGTFVRDSSRRILGFNL